MSHKLQVLALLFLTESAGLSRAHGQHPATTPQSDARAHTLALCAASSAKQPDSDGGYLHQLDSAAQISSQEAEAFRRACFLADAYLDITGTATAEVASSHAAGAVRELLAAKTAGFLRPTGLDVLASLVSYVESTNDLPTIVGYRQRIADALYDAARDGNAPRSVVRGCAELALALGDGATARCCLARDLAAGGDSTWAYVRQSWLASVHHDSAGALRLLAAAVSAAADSEAIGELKDRASIAGALGKRKGSAGDAGNMPSTRAGDEVLATLLRSESDPGFLGEMFAKCPVWREQDGARSQAPSYRCMWSHEPPPSAITVVASMHRIWDGASHQLISLFSFAAPTRDLDMDDGSHNRSATVDVNIRRWNMATGAWTDTTLKNIMLRAIRIGDSSEIGGTVVLTGASEPASWSTAIAQYGRYGRLSVDGTPAILEAPVTFSDLVIGVKSHGLTHLVGEDTVVLMATATLSRREPMQVYYQVKNERGPQTLQSSVVLRPIRGGVVGGTAILKVDSPLHLQSGMNSVFREIVLARVAPGNYQFSVEARDLHGVVVGHREVNLFVR